MTATGKPTNDFIRHITASQNRLYAYILSLLLDLDAAEEVLQRTNLVLWEKAGEFEPGSDFGAWACKVAYFEVLAYRRDAGRDRLCFDDDLLRELAEAAPQQTEDMDERRRALLRCLAGLDSQQAALVRKRYSSGNSIEQISELLGTTKAAVVSSLYRIRRSLLECVQGKLAREAT